jgi:predicted kinase
LIAIKAEVALLGRRAAGRETHTAQKEESHEDVPLQDFKSINHEGHEGSQRNKPQRQQCLAF